MSISFAPPATDDDTVYVDAPFGDRAVNVVDRARSHVAMLQVLLDTLRALVLKPNAASKAHRVRDAFAAHLAHLDAELSHMRELPLALAPQYWLQCRETLAHNDGPTEATLPSMYRSSADSPQEHNVRGKDIVRLLVRAFQNGPLWQ